MASIEYRKTTALHTKKLKCTKTTHYQDIIPSDNWLHKVSGRFNYYLNQKMIVSTDRIGI